MTTFLYPRYRQPRIASWIVAGRFLAIIRASMQAVLVLTLVAQSLVAAASADEPAKHESTLRLWIEQLDSEHFHVRRSAHANLVKAGRPARALLRDVGDEKSLETKKRAQTILREMLGEGVVLYLPDEISKSASANEDDAGLSHLEQHSLRLPETGPVVVRDTAASTRTINSRSWLGFGQLKSAIEVGSGIQTSEQRNSIHGGKRIRHGKGTSSHANGVVLVRMAITFSRSLHRGGSVLVSATARPKDSCPIRSFHNDRSNLIGGRTWQQVSEEAGFVCISTVSLIRRNDRKLF